VPGRERILQEVIGERAFLDGELEASNE